MRLRATFVSLLVVASLAMGLSLYFLFQSNPTSPETRTLTYSTSLVDEDEPVIHVMTEGDCAHVSGWIKHLEESGYRTRLKTVDDLQSIKENKNIPVNYRNCHTALVDGYVIEGHVPAKAIANLRNETPDIIGLAVPGEPSYAPGIDGRRDKSLVVYQIRKNRVLRYMSF